jgi:hypothetical protein
VSKIADIQQVLGVSPDGIWGPKSQAAFDDLVGVPAPSTTIQNHGKASSFADPRDVEQFNKWKQIFLDRGKSDEDATKLAFGYGDNGIGFWGDSTAEGSGPSCALPPDDMVERWGSVDAARNKLVDVAANGKEVTCVLRDTMPWRKDITNGAVIDLNPDAVRALGLEPPIMVQAAWRWV